VCDGSMISPVDTVSAVMTDNNCPEEGTLSELFCAVLCTTFVQNHTHTRTWAVLKVDCWFRFSLDLGLLFVFCHFVPVLFAFVV